MLMGHWSILVSEISELKAIVKLTEWPDGGVQL